MNRKPCAVLIAALGVVASVPAAAGEIDDLKSMVQQLQQRLDQLEKQQKTQAAAPAAAAPANVVTAGDIPGSIKVPGTDTSLKIYGYAQLDVTHDINGRGRDINGNDWASFLPVQPLDNTLAGVTHKGQTYATARTSRLGFMTSTPTKSGTLTTKVEADFNAPNAFQGELLTNSVLFRLRHAYGQLGNVLVGQTWSNFADLGSVPETVDFNGPGTYTAIRQPQLRYTLPLGASSLAFSVENPQSFELEPVLNSKLTKTANFDKTPDFTANWTMAGDKGHFSVRAVSHEYRNDTHSKRGYGLGLGGSVKLGADTLVASVTTGNGLGRYLVNSALQGAVETGTEIGLWKTTGLHLGYTHVWNSAWRSNLAMAGTRFSASDAVKTAQLALPTGDDFKPNRRINEAFLNTFWGFEKNMEVGLEYAYGKRKTFLDEVGTQKRINATFHYNFY